MAFRAAFIGINKHQDPGIPELNGACRDAGALHALFCDSFPDIEAHLLLDEAASLDSVRGVLDDALGAAGPEDVVVLSFAGHGTKSHQLVAYDTDRDSLGATALPMEELARRFQSSKARAILCIIDACFSGAAPARVLEGTPAPRAPMADYSSFRGKGRFLLAAASPSQPAWEEPGSGHGLLTRSVIDVLTSGVDSIDITAAVGQIVAATRAYAKAIGEQQDACFVGGVEGGLVLPVLVHGERWRTLFPDLSQITVTSNIADLTAFGISPEVLALWEARFPGGLNGLQLESVNRHRILNGESLLVVAPTSSGKTFIGEMAAVRAALNGQKSIFLLPYRALVNEKYEDFSATYGLVGLRVVRCSGDFTDETSLFLSGRYDVAILTFEMFLGLAVANSQVLRPLGLVVLDEAQFITDPNRGITVELLLTLILSARARGVSPQLMALSAVIGGVNKFDEWLGCGCLVWTRRPVPLIEGVLDRSGTYETLDADGREITVDLLPRHAIRQRKDKPSAQDVIVPLVQSLVRAGEKVLIFRNTRGPAEGCANYLARELGLLSADAALSQLPVHDLSSSAEALRACLIGGTAFHNSNLRRDERVVVERHFRDVNGAIRVLAATTTLAAGINTPASTVILAEQEFRGEDGRPFTVAEYKNMAGRAGRLGFNETGKAIILAETPMQRRQLFGRYVRGVPESIFSSFSDQDVRTWVIRLLSQVRAIDESAVPHLLASTYGGFLAGERDPSWKQQSEHRIGDIVHQFIDLGLLERHNGAVQLSLLGRACGRSTLSFESSMRLIEAIRAIPEGELSPFGLVGVLQILPEADDQYTPIRRRARSESARVDDAIVRFGRTIVRTLQRWVPDEHTFWARCKRASILADWMAGRSIQEIEAAYSLPFGGQVQLGDIQRFADGTRFHLQSAHQILAALLEVNAVGETEFEQVMRRLEFGVPADLIPFMENPIALTRGECLALAQRGIRTIAALGEFSTEQITTLLGEERGKRILEAAAAKTSEETRPIPIMSLGA